MTERADVVVIGMGPGGEAVAGQLAGAGLDVIGIERELVGGECPYWGCIPSKMAIRAANSLAEARRVGRLAGSAIVSPDWEPVAQRIRDEATDNWHDRVAVERFVGKGGRFVRGLGRIVAPGTVAVGDDVIEARRGIVVATGAQPLIPPIPGLDTIPYWTNREALKANELPWSLVVLGGGAIGAELAQVFARFGSRVTIVEALDRLLPLEEPEAGRVVADAFAADGIEVRVGVSAAAVTRAGHGYAVRLADGSVVTGEEVLVATGRRADPAVVGLDAVGIPLDTPTLPIDGHLRIAEGVWAVGDVAGHGAFTHVAVHQARIIAADILGEDPDPFEEHAIPRVTFTDPEVGAVGLTEQAARRAGIDVAVGRATVPSSARGWIHKAGNDGIIKVVADRSRAILVGGTAAGPAGGEVLGLLALAVHARTPVADLRRMMFAYPTFHRAIEGALRDLDV